MLFHRYPAITGPARVLLGASLLLTGLSSAASPAPTRQEAASAPPQQATLTVEQVVERAGRALEHYAQQLSLIVGVEHYSQYMGDESFSRAFKRLLVSEFALVRVKDDWLGFRDVYEVDGKPVQDRQDRLAKLFSDAPADAVAQARAISNEGARQNLGAIQRNFNVPTMALFFLGPSNVPRFRFHKDGEDRIDGTPVWKVRYEETRKPTIIRTSAGKDMPVTGTFWIDPADGRVVKTHMQILVDVTIATDREAGRTVNPALDGTRDSVVQRLRSSASITVTYHQEAKLGLMVPAEMLETYEGPTLNRFTGKEEMSRVNCRATYSDFKRFETSGRALIPK